jgi:uncharacterized membrane protein YfcA
VIVAVTSLGGLVGHRRAGHVRLRAGVAFGVAGVGGSIVGSHINTALPARVLLVTFAALMMVAAAGMLRREGDQGDRRRAWGGERGGAAVRDRVTAATVARVLFAGTIVGLLTGLFGVGGGFVVVPALVLVLGFNMSDAIGTSLVAVALNAATALAARIAGGGQIDWTVAVPFTIAGLAGAVIGTAVAGRVRADRLKRGFALLLIMVAVFMVFDASRSAVVT